jgi:hypothetical protein
MAYPPTVPPANRSNTTPQADNHPSDHNGISSALSAIVNELGSNPSGPQGSVQSRISHLENNTLPLSGGNMTGVIHLSDTSYDAVADNAAMPRNWIVDKFLNKSGDTMTGALSVGGDPTQTPAWKIWATGTSNSAVNAAGSASLVLRRGIAASGAGERFVRFEKGADPGTLVSVIELGTPNDRIVISNCTVTAPSDYRLKERVGPITDSARRIADLARRTFRGRWKNTDGGEWDMLSAHDIAEVAPYAVQGDKDGDDTQQVAWGDLVPLLVSALGNALDRIAALEAAAP